MRGAAYGARAGPTMKRDVFSVCYEEGDVLGWLLSYVLYYPWAITIGFMVAGHLFKNPLLLYKTYVSNAGTWLYAWGFSTLLKWERPPGQECDRSYAYPDVGLHLASINSLSLLILLALTRRGVGWLSLLWFLGWMVLYYVAIVLNGYMSALQFVFNLASVLLLSSFWCATYFVLVRPILAAYGYADHSKLGTDTAPAFPPPRSIRLEVSGSAGAGR